MVGDDVKTPYWYGTHLAGASPPTAGRDARRIAELDQVQMKDRQASVATQPAPADALASAPSRSDLEFARARRHSRWVRRLKIALPATAALIVVAGIATTWLARSLPDNVTVAGTSIQDGRVVMQDPRMSGVDGQERPYEMRAERAIQSLTGGGVDLEKVRARLSVDEDTTADITAVAGVYDVDTEKLRLTEGIEVQTSNGIVIRLETADIDLEAGTMVGGGPVAIDTPSQTIRASSLTVSEGGKVLSFGGRVRMVIAPSPQSGPAEKQAFKSE